MPPPSRREIEQTLRAILTDLFPDHEIGSLRDDDDLVAVLDLDSMAQIDIVLEIERRLGCHVPDEEIAELTSLRVAADYLETSLQAA